MFRFILANGRLFAGGLSLGGATGSHGFVCCAFVPCVFVLTCLVPINDAGVCNILRICTCSNGLISRNVYFLISTILLLFTCFELGGGRGNARLSLPTILIINYTIFFTLPISKLSLYTVMVTVLTLFNAGPGVTFECFVSLDTPVLLIRNVVRVTAYISCIGVFTNVVNIIVTVTLAFVTSGFLLRVIGDGSLGCFSCCNFAINNLALVVKVVRVVMEGWFNGCGEWV